MLARVRRSVIDIPRNAMTFGLEELTARTVRSAMITLDAAHTCTLVATGGYFRHDRGIVATRAEPQAQTAAAPLLPPINASTKVRLELLSLRSRSAFHHPPLRRYRSPAPSPTYRGRICPCNPWRTPIVPRGDGRNATCSKRGRSQQHHIVCCSHPRV